MSLKGSVLVISCSASVEYRLRAFNTLVFTGNTNSELCFWPCKGGVLNNQLQATGGVGGWGELGRTAAIDHQHKHARIHMETQANLYNKTKLQKKATDR